MKRTFALFVCSLAAAIFLAGNAHAQSGSALVFDGVNDFANIPLFATNAPTNEITIELWQNVSGPKAQGSFSLAPDNIANRINAHVPWLDGVVYWDFGNINTAGRLAYTPPNPITNSWQHFAFVASSNGNYMRIYRNGVLEAQKTGMTPITRGNVDLHIGEVGGGFFAGQIDEFRIWNVARSSNEISTNFMRSLVGNEAGLVLYLRCNEGSGTSTADAAALGGNTTAFLSNGVAWAASGASVGGLFVTMADSLFIDTNNNGRVNSGDTLRYTVTIQNNSTNTLTNVVLNVPANPNATLVPGSVKVPPKAVDDGPASNSVPGNAFHVALNTAFNLSAPGLLANDTVGAPAGSIASFGGGSFPGTATTTASGSPAIAANVGTLTVNANGSVTFTPTSTFNGLATFQYRLTNALGASVANGTIAVGNRPAATNESFFFTGNTMLDSSLIPQSLLANDAGDGIGISGNTAPGSGAMAVFANGNFRYQPAVGFVGGLSINYTITNGFGSSVATVTLTSVARVWYIDGASVAGTADGRSDTPFKTIAQFNAVNNGAANNPADNDVILLRDGTYTDGTILRLGQRLIGDGSSGGVSNALGVALAAGSALAPGVAIPAFSGIDPVIQNAAVGGYGILLNANNTIRGLTVGDTPNGHGYAGAAVGGLTISESSKTGAGGAIIISVSGGLSVSFDTLDSVNQSASTVAAIHLVGCSGTLSATAGNISGSAGAGIFISGGGGNITYPGNVTKNNAGRLVEILGRTSGTITLGGNLAQNNASGTGINVSSNTASTVTFSGTSKVLNTAANSALCLTNNTTTTINFLNGGLDIDTTTGAGVVLVSANNLTISGAGNSITTGTGTSFLNNGGGGTIDVNASLTGTGRLIDIQNRGNGSLTLSGNLNNTGTGVLIQNNIAGGSITLSGTTKTFNTGANTAVSLVGNPNTTINFTGGGLALTTTSGSGFNATGGGTISVQGTGNMITSGNGTALNVANTTIGANRLTFQSITAGTGAIGPSSGIVLNTVPGGGLLVTGTGAANSGGVIQHTTSHGVSITAAANVEFNRVSIHDTGDHGIFGDGVDGFVFRDSTIFNFGNALPSSGASEDAMHFESVNSANTAAGHGLTGTVVIQRNTIGPDGHFTLTPFPTLPENKGIVVRNHNDVNLNMNVTGTTFFQISNDGIDAEVTDGTSTISVDGSTADGANQFNQINGRAVNFQNPIDNAAARVFDLTIRNNGFNLCGIAGRWLASGRGTVNARFNGNSATNITNDAIRSESDAVNAALTPHATVNATIGTNKMGGGSIFISNHRQAVANIAFINNTNIGGTAAGVGGSGSTGVHTGMNVNSDRGSTVNIDIVNNAVTADGSNTQAQNALYLQTSNNGGGSSTVCAKITGNTLVENPNPSGSLTIALDTVGGQGNINIEGWNGSSPTVQAYLASVNTLVGGVADADNPAFVHAGGNCVTSTP